jgi:dTDP-4-dehydrorhamnose 3,5-epimerase
MLRASLEIRYRRWFIGVYNLNICVVNFVKTEIEGVYILEPKLFSDARGYFYESFSEREFLKGIAGVECDGLGNGEGLCRFVQENQSKSCYGVVRGLHFQRPPFEQSKLVKVVKGSVLDIAVDIRRGSPTFGKYVAVELTEDNHKQFFMPRGFAHGFSVLSNVAVFEYKCDNYYAPEYEGAIAWDDPDLAIDWQIPAENIILSEKDKHHPLLVDLVLN